MQERINDLLNPYSSAKGPLKPKDRLKLEAKRKKLMADGTEESVAEARELLKQLSPAFQGDDKMAPKVAPFFQSLS